jgi:hypothetical protein
MPARITPTAWHRGAKNALVCLPIVLVSWLLMAGLICSFFHLSFRQSFFLAFVALQVASLLLFLGVCLRHFNAGGRVLLDCGRLPTNVFHMISSAFIVAIGTCGGFIMAFGTNDGFAASLLPNSYVVAGLVIGALSGFLFLTMALGRLQIREDGLWQYWFLLRWEQIESCWLSGDSTLVVQAKTRFPFLGRGALPVPPEQKDALSEILKKRCPVWDPEF